MYITPWFAVQLGLLLVGVWWCKEVFGRFHDDVQTLKEAEDTTHKVLIVVFWLLTVLIIIWITSFVWDIITAVIAAFS